MIGTLRYSLRLIDREMMVPRATRAALVLRCARVLLSSATLDLKKNDVIWSKLVLKAETLLLLAHLPQNLSKLVSTVGVEAIKSQCQNFAIFMQNLSKSNWPVH